MSTPLTPEQAAVASGLIGNANLIQDGCKLLLAALMEGDMESAASVANNINLLASSINGGVKLLELVTRT